MHDVSESNDMIERECDVGQVNVYMSESNNRIEHEHKLGQVNDVFFLYKIQKNEVQKRDDKEIIHIKDDNSTGE